MEIFEVSIQKFCLFGKSGMSKSIDVIVFSSIANVVLTFVLLAILSCSIYSGHGSVTYEVKENEEVMIKVFTRCTSGAKFTVTDADHKRPSPWVENVEVKHGGTSDTNEYPTSVTITTTNIPGPEHIKVKADSMTSRWSSSNYLLVFTVYAKKA